MVCNHNDNRVSLGVFYMKLQYTDAAGETKYDRETAVSFMMFPKGYWNA